MSTESEYGDDIQLLDDLTRLKIRLIDKVLMLTSVNNMRIHQIAVN